MSSGVLVSVVGVGSVGIVHPVPLVSSPLVCARLLLCGDIFCVVIFFVW